MIFVNQRDYPHLPYPHPTIPDEEFSVFTSGCGLASLIMVVENLTTARFTMEEALVFAAEKKANLCRGTALKILAPATAERFGLDYARGKDMDEVLSCLQKGGMAVALTEGDRNGRIGLFTHGQHFITLAAYDGEDLCVLDPYLYDGKYEEEGRAGRVRLDAPFLYCPPETVDGETDPALVRYHLFFRKKP
ncbi:MAG: hypothetical protein II776_03640 [Clostridia bacterium]|nr:hypothetical protein [Clostridia bacterium]